MQLVEKHVTVCASAKQAAHGVLGLTEWDEFREVDFARILDSMNRPASLFDGRNVVDARALGETGFEVRKSIVSMIGHLTRLPGDARVTSLSYRLGQT